MAWDDDKSTDDELTADEWDAHVADQKGRAENIVQASEPPVASEGTLWTELISVFSQENLYTSDADSTVYVTSDGVIVYIDTTLNSIRAHDIDTNSQLWSYSVNNTPEALAVCEPANSVWTAGDVSGDTNVYEIDLTDGTEKGRAGYDYGQVDNVEDLAVNDNNDAYVHFDFGGSPRVGDASQTQWPFANVAEFGTITVGPNGVYHGYSGGIDEYPINIDGTSGTSISSRSVFGNMFFNDSHIYIGDSPVEKMDEFGNSQWTVSADGNIGFDSSADEVYIADAGDVHQVDDTDGSIINTVTLPSGQTSTYVGRYNGESYITTTDDEVATYGSVNEYTLYISDGSRWMPRN